MVSKVSANLSSQPLSQGVAKVFASDVLEMIVVVSGVCSIMHLTHQVATFVLENLKPSKPVEISAKIFIYVSLPTIGSYLLNFSPHWTVIALLIGNAVVYCFNQLSVKWNRGHEASKLPSFLSNMAEEVGDRESLIVGNEKRIRQLETKLCNNRKPNVLLVGKAGVGKSALMEQIALRIQQNKIDSKSPLYQKRIFALDHVAFGCDTKYVGQTNDKIRALLTFTKSNPDVIVFMDEFHLIVSMGKSGSRSEGGAAQYLKIPITQNQIRIIGACTEEEYKKIIATDAAFQRRFQKIVIDEPSMPDCLKILRQRVQKDSGFQGLSFTDDALGAIVAITQLFEPHIGQPDKAITFMELIAAHAADWDNKTVDLQCVAKVLEDENQIKTNLTMEWYTERFKETKVYKEMFPVVGTSSSLSNDAQAGVNSPQSAVVQAVT